MPRHMVVAEEATRDAGWQAKCSGCEGCSSTSVTPAPQAHLFAPYQPCCSPDQQTAGQYLGPCWCGLMLHAVWGDPIPNGTTLRAFLLGLWLRAAATWNQAQALRPNYALGNHSLSY